MVTFWMAIADCEFYNCVCQSLSIEACMKFLILEFHWALSGANYTVQHFLVCFLRFFVLHHRMLVFNDISINMAMANLPTKEKGA